MMPPPVEFCQERRPNATLRVDTCRESDSAFAVSTRWGGNRSNARASGDACAFCPVGTSLPSVALGRTLWQAWGAAPGRSWRSRSSQTIATCGSGERRPSLLIDVQMPRRPVL